MQICGLKGTSLALKHFGIAMLIAFLLKESIERNLYWRTEGG